MSPVLSFIPQASRKQSNDLFDFCTLQQFHKLCSLCPSLETSVSLEELRQLCCFPKHVLACLSMTPALVQNLNNANRNGRLQMITTSSKDEEKIDVKFFLTTLMRKSKKVGLVCIALFFTNFVTLAFYSWWTLSGNAAIVLFTCPFFHWLQLSYQ